jgi:hypothetical protein
MSAGSGSLRTLTTTNSATAKMATVGRSTIARRPRTQAAPAMAPAAAAVTPPTNAFTRSSRDHRRTLGASRITTSQGGRKTPAAATSPPAAPATRKPMNATVITTGPGVIIATATASRNCRSSSQ